MLLDSIKKNKHLNTTIFSTCYLNRKKKQQDINLY
jgi:hypothetical protein